MAQNIFNYLKDATHASLTDLSAKILEKDAASYAIHLCSPIFIPVIVLLAAIDGSLNILHNIKHALPFLATNLLLKYPSVSNPITNNIILVGLNFLYLDNINLIFEKMAIELMNHIIDIHGHAFVLSAQEIIFYIARTVILNYLYSGNILTANIKPEVYLYIFYVFPLMKYVKNNYNSNVNMTTLEKVFLVNMTLAKPSIGRIQQQIMNLLNTQLFVINGLLVSPMDIMLAIQTLLEQQNGKPIYSINELTALHRINCYSPITFLRFLYANFTNRTTDGLPTIGNTTNITFPIKKLLKFAEQNELQIQDISEQDIQLYHNNILKYASINSEQERQTEFLEICNLNSVRKMILSKYDNIGIEILTFLINQIVDVNDNIDFLVNLLLPLEKKYTLNHKSETGQNVAQFEGVPLKLFKNKRFNVVIEIPQHHTNSDSYAYHIPYELLYAFKNLAEIMSLFFEIMYYVAEYKDFHKTPATQKHYVTYLFGRIVEHIALDALPIPLRITTNMGYTPNNRYPIYCCNQLHHTSSSDYASLFTIIKTTETNVNVLNTYLITAYYSGLLKASSTYVPSIASGMPLYNRMCKNNLLDFFNNKVQDIQVITSYLHYIFQHAPNIYLTCQIYQNMQISVCINNLFNSDLDQFIAAMMAIQSIIPGIASLESFIFIREMLCGMYKNTWLEQIINMFLNMNYEFEADEIGIEDREGTYVKHANSKIFQNLLKFTAHGYVPESTYTLHSAAHLFMPILFNQPPYRGKTAQYYKFSPTKHIKRGISAKFNAKTHDDFILDESAKEKTLVPNRLANNSVYNKILDADLYYNKACEAINLYEKETGYMLRMLTEYSPYMQLAKYIVYCDTSNIKHGIVIQFNLRDMIIAALREQLFSPINTSFLQIYAQGRNYEIEDVTVRPKFVKQLAPSLGVDYRYPHHSQILYWHCKIADIFIYNYFALDRLVFLANALVSCYHSSKLYHIKDLAKFHMKPYWFKSTSLYKQGNGLLIIIKANSKYERDGRLYLGKFTYEIGYKHHNNIYTISTVPFIKHIYALLKTLYFVGIRTNEDQTRFYYYQREKNNLLGFVVLIDLLGCQTYSKIISPDNHGINDIAAFKRYRLRQQNITEYSISNLAFLPLLFLQSSEQYVVQNSNTSTMGNNHVTIGVMNIEDGIILLKDATITAMKNMYSTITLALAHMLQIVFWLIRYIADNMRKLGSRNVNKQLTMLERELQATTTKTNTNTRNTIQQAKVAAAA